MKLITLIVLCSALATANLFSGITQDNLKKHVGFLASDSLEGRKAGTAKGKQAADYVAKQFAEIGLKNFDNSYYQNFSYSNVHAQNVIGIIEATNPKFTDEYIVLGAHFDHIGFAVEAEDSYIKAYQEEFSREKAKIEVMNGADDNASGTAAIIEIAKMLMNSRDKLQRNIIVVAFDGEEDGLFGSRHFTNHPPVEISKIRAMLNLDMVGNLGDNGVYYTGFGTMDDGDKLEKDIELVKGLKVEFEDHASKWRDNTDHGPFYRQEIPCLTATTGWHYRYHRSNDDIDFLNFDGLEQICYQSYNVILALASKEEYKFETTSEWIKNNLNSYKFGMYFDYARNSFSYSEGAFDGKSKYGGAVGFFYNTDLSKYINFDLGARYRYSRSHSFKGDLDLHSAEVPMKLSLSTPSYNYMPFRALFFVGADLHYSFGGKLGGENISWAEMGINQFRASWNLGIRIEIFNFFMELYYFNSPITPFFKDSDEKLGDIKLHNKIVGFGFSF